MSEQSGLVDNYLAGPARLRLALQGMTRDQLLARPVAGKWSAMELVCHLSDFDPILAERMKRIISHDRPALLGADENRFAATLAYHERHLDEELSLIELTRAQMARILRTLPPEALDRVGVHSERGEMTLRRVLTMAAGHVEHHLKFLEEKKKALGLAG